MAFMVFFSPGLNFATLTQMLLRNAGWNCWGPEIAIPERHARSTLSMGTASQGQLVPADPHVPSDSISVTSVVLFQVSFLSFV